MYAQDIINAALLAINVLASGESPTTNESNDALCELNRLISSWNAQRLMIYTVAGQTFPLTPGQQTYTFGSGGNFNATRPARIERASIIINTETTQPLEVPIRYLTLGQYQYIPVKAIPSPIPYEVYDDGGFPLRNLTYFPYPSAGNTSTTLYCWNPLSCFANLSTTEYEFPPAYDDAIHWNLAVRLAPMFGVLQMNPVVPHMAQESLAVVKSINVDATLEPARCDPAVVKGRSRVWDWRTGDWFRGGR